MKTFDCKVGDVVRLKSGGPCMTVINDDMRYMYEVICQWFDKNDIIHQHQFVISALIKEK